MSTDATSAPGTDTRGTDTSGGPVCTRSRYATFPECPHCGGELHPEHAHFRCGTCGWRDSCCD